MINPNQLGRSPFPAGASQWMLVGLRGGAAPVTPHLLDTLVSYWKLDEASGTRNDSQSTNHLSDVTSTASTSGKINNGALFNGTTNYLSRASNASLQVTGDFTFASWVRIDGQPDLGVIVGKADAGTSIEYTVFYQGPGGGGGGIVVAVNNFAAYAAVGGTVPNGTWLHIMAWYDSSDQKCRLRINDATTYTGTNTSGLIQLTNQFIIGARSATGNWLAGVIDEVGFWKRLLTATEMTALYNGGAGLPYSSFTA